MKTEEEKRDYKKEYYARPEVKARTKEYQKKYHDSHKAELKENKKEYSARPEVKARTKEYNKTPAKQEYNKKYIKEYNKKPEVIIIRKDRQKKVRSTEEYKKYVKTYRLKKFNLTDEQYDAKFNKQEGKCEMCGRHQSKFKKALANDHNHDTNQNRGLLCTRCNLIVGVYEKHKSMIENYLSKYVEGKDK
jgi:hypothetical protein